MSHEWHGDDYIHICTCSNPPFAGGSILHFEGLKFRDESRQERVWRAFRLSKARVDERSVVAAVLGDVMAVDVVLVDY